MAFNICINYALICVVKIQFFSMAHRADTDIINELALKPFRLYSFNEKKLLVDNDRPTPKIKLTKANKGFTRKFNCDLYKSVHWLCGSDSNNKVYCWPCILFSKENSVWSRANRGYEDLNNIHTAISRHERTMSHIQAHVELKQFGKSRVDFMLDRPKEVAIIKHNEEVLRNREILKRLIRMTCYLGIQELAFHGHNKTELPDNRDNYVELAYLLSEFDEKMEKPLHDSIVFEGLSKTIQNEIIESINSVLLNEVKNELSKCRHVTILLDETSDVSCLSQLSIVMRYVNENGNICERFLGFTDVSKDRSGADISSLVIKHLDDLDCTKKLVAQSYDGAAVKTSELSNVQRKIKEVAPGAIFVHCYAHKHNLILSQVVSHISKCNTFFSLLASLSSFFSSSLKQNTLLDDVGKLFPTLASISWNHSSGLVEIIKEDKQNLKNLFDYIQENSIMFDDKTKNEARAFSVAFDSFDFNFVLQIFSAIYPLTEGLFKVLQKKSLGITFCASAVQITIRKIQEIRGTKFDDIWKVVFENFGLPSSRKRRDIPIVIVYREIFFEVLDIIIEHMKERFNFLNELEFLELLDFERFKCYQLAFPEKAFKSLEKNYRSFFDFARLKSELTILFSQKYFAQNNIYDLYKYILTNELNEVFPGLHSFINLVLTLPISTSSVEQSFSALERVKIYLRNFEGQERLSNLALISIEKSFLKRQMEEKEKFYDDVIKEFCLKSRREEFQFK